MEPRHRSSLRIRRNEMLHTGLLIGAAFAGLAAPTGASAQAVIAFSDFEIGSDGWFSVGDPQCPHPEYWSIGGNPGGRIRMIDGQEGVGMWFSAPAMFIGDQSAAYGGSLSFDILLENSSDSGNLTKVWLIGDGIRLVMASTDNPPPNTWYTYRFNLDESAGWMARDCVGGREATREDMIHVLSNLSALLIQGEYSGSRDICNLDNVILATRDVSPRFIPLGDLSGGDVESRSRGVSSDGAVVVGTSFSEKGIEAFRWVNGVMIGLGDLPGGRFSSEGVAVSGAGSIAVGTSSSENSEGQHGDREAFVWKDGVMIGLGDLPGGAFLSEALAVSPDGSMIVGRANSQGNEAFRWVDGEMIGLGDLPGGIFDSIAYGVSADGSVIVGYSSSEDGPGGEACRWVNGEIGGLGDLPGGEFRSHAYDVSLDGSVIVGGGTGAQGREAVVWMDGQMMSLGDLPGGGFESTATGVSGDGEIIVGYGTTDNGQEAFLWSLSEGLQNLREWLIAKGVDVPSGWQLTGAYDISDDGTTVVGDGINPDGNIEGWLVHLPERNIPCDAIHRLKVECASETLSARLKSSLPVGTELTLDNNGDEHKTVIINARGKGKVRWTRQVGVHTVTVVECPEQSREADCG